MKKQVKTQKQQMAELEADRKIKREEIYEQVEADKQRREESIQKAKDRMAEKLKTKTDDKEKIH